MSALMQHNGYALVGCGLEAQVIRCALELSAMQCSTASRHAWAIVFVHLRAANSCIHTSMPLHLLQTRALLMCFLPIHLQTHLHTAPLLAHHHANQHTHTSIFRCLQTIGTMHEN